MRTHMEPRQQLFGVLLSCGTSILGVLDRFSVQFANNDIIASPQVLPNPFINSFTAVLNSGGEYLSNIYLII